MLIAANVYTQFTTITGNSRYELSIPNDIDNDIKKARYTTEIINTDAIESIQFIPADNKAELMNITLRSGKPIITKFSHDLMINVSQQSINEALMNTNYE